VLHDQQGGDAKYVLKNAEASALAAWVKDYAVSCGIAGLRDCGILVPLFLATPAGPACQQHIHDRPLPVFGQLTMMRPAMVVHPLQIFDHVYDEVVSASSGIRALIGQHCIQSSTFVSVTAAGR